MLLHRTLMRRLRNWDLEKTNNELRAFTSVGAFPFVIQNQFYGAVTLIGERYSNLLSPDAYLPSEEMNCSERFPEGLYTHRFDYDFITKNSSERFC